MKQRNERQARENKIGRFDQYRECPKGLNLEIVLEDKAGYGLRTKQPITINTKIGYYFGERYLSLEEFKLLGAKGRTKNYAYTFLNPVTKKVVDARKTYNYLRYVNHSNTPNCIVVWDLQPFPMFQALRDIRVGEYLSFDYNITDTFNTVHKFLNNKN